MELGNHVRIRTTLGSSYWTWSAACRILSISVLRPAREAGTEAAKPRPSLAARWRSRSRMSTASTRRSQCSNGPSQRGRMDDDDAIAKPPGHTVACCLPVEAGTMCMQSDLGRDKAGIGMKRPVQKGVASSRDGGQRDPKSTVSLHSASSLIQTSAERRLRRRL